MHYQPVVDRISLPVPLDPIWAMLYVALFVAVTLVTARRAAYGLGVLILAQPFATYHYVLDTTITLPKVVLLGVLLGLTTSFDWRAALSPRPIKNILLVGVILVIVVAATALVAADRAAVLRETLKWIEYLALFAAVCVGYTRDPNDGLLVRCWVIVTIIVSLLALAQEIIGAPSGLSINGEIVPRIAGPLEGPNQLAGYLELSLAVLCAWSGRDRLIPVALVVAVCTLALTFSRGGIAAAAVAVVVILATRQELRRAAIKPLAIGTAFGAVLVATWTALAHTPGALPLTPSPSYAGGVGNRTELWRAALTLWQRHPLLGVGAGNFEEDLGQVGLFGIRTHANSWYLQALAEGGIILLLSTLALVATILVNLSNRLRTAAPWQLAAFAGSLAFALHQVFDDLIFYPKVGGPWWILVALGASAVALRKPT